jgi:predicted transcriptional regulator
MEVQELKFLLDLLGSPDYRAPITQIKPNPKTKAMERDAICRALADRELVGYSEEILNFSISPAGKSLLQLDPARLPIAEAEVSILRACAESTITPAQTDIQAATRQSVIQGLAEKGLIKAEKSQITEVWLTPRGQEYLREEYNPSGTLPVVSLDMLTNYVRFLRKSLRSPEVSVMPSSSLSLTPGSSPEVLVSKPLSDDEIVRLIQELDREFATDNYLPIFYLRQRLQPPLSREELDCTLYRLQRSDRIELSSLQEAISYSPEQIESGISQDIGGPLFFIIVTQ